MQEGDDNYNCGPFVCWYAECIISGQPLEVDELEEEEFDIEEVRALMGNMLEEARIGTESNHS